ncbi:MAG: diguanylate cyclase domain-containing protein, partial [Bacteroidota bacterium]
MAKSPSSGLRRKLINHDCLFLKERAILLVRFGIVIFNYWFIFLRQDADPAVNQFTHLSTPLFFLVYGLTIWFGPKFLSYRKINIILSIPEILLVSFGFYVFPDQLALGGFLIYLVGITVNILYGSYISSILLALLVNFCYTFAAFHHLKTEQHRYFFLLIANFNLVALLIGIIGWKIKIILETIRFEKEESKKQLLRLQALSRITKEITSELELDKLLNLIVKKTSELMKSDAGGIITLENSRTYRIKAIKGIAKDSLGKEVKLGTGLLGQALNERKITFLKINTDTLDTAPIPDEQYNFLIASPILSKGELLGLIFLLSDSQSSPLSKDDRLILETMSEFAAIGMVNANLFKKTAILSVNDFLTGVGNLRYFYQQLEHCIAVAERYQQSCSLMMIDSDCFREIKHTYGNAQGFVHIQYLAEILKKCIRSSDLIAR